MAQRSTDNAARELRTITGAALLAALAWSLVVGASLAFLWFMAQADTQKMLTEVGHIPSNPAVAVDDPILAGFLKQTASASYFPNEPEMGAVWTPAGDMIVKVIEGKSTPADAVAEACSLIDAANGK